MLHLFNKVYLEFDDKIDVNLDRVVISNRYGIPMSQNIEKISYGKVIHFSKNLNELNSTISFENLITELKLHGDSSGKKIMIYCDKQNYIRFMATWFKLVLPNLDYITYVDLAKLYIYRERCISNTQLVTTGSVNLGLCFEEFSNDDWKEGWDNLIPTKVSPTSIGLTISYEFLLTNYLAGDRNFVQPLLKTAHKFLRRFFQEIFTDNRQMVSLNINNHRLQHILGYDDIVDLSHNPLSLIPALKYYADNEIWQTPTTTSSGVYGICNLSNLSQEKIDGLRNTTLKIFNSFEGMQINSTVFEGFRFLEVACRDQMTQDELEEIIESISESPFDTCFIPRFDYENINFPLLLHVLRKYHKQDTSYLHKFIIRSV